MISYERRVNYYRTDKMGITHHSNYSRFMEEARMDYLQKFGCPMTLSESKGLTSPAVSLSCEYKHPTTYSDSLVILVTVKKYTGARLCLGYKIINRDTGELAARAESTHCFIDSDNEQVSVKRHIPELDTALRRELEEVAKHGADEYKCVSTRTELRTDPADRIAAALC